MALTRFSGPIRSKHGFEYDSNLKIEPMHIAKVRATRAQVNADHVVLPGISGKKIKMHDYTLMAIGGNAETATSIKLTSKQGGSDVDLTTVLVAALTRGTAVKPNSANTTLLADGAAFNALDEGEGITIENVGSALATATHVDATIFYTVE